MESENNDNHFRADPYDFSAREVKLFFGPHCSSVYPLTLFLDLYYAMTPSSVPDEFFLQMMDEDDLETKLFLVMDSEVHNS